MSFDSTQFKRLDEFIKATELEQLRDLRQGAFDHGAYRDRCGYLRALTDLKAQMAKIESDIRQGK